FLVEPGWESSVNPVGLVIIRKNAASPSPQVIEQLLEQLETWDQILVFLPQVMDQVEGPAQHLVGVDRRDPKIRVRGAGQLGGDYHADGVGRLEVTQGVRVQEIHTSGSSSGLRSRRRAFRIARYCWERASSWNEGMVARQGSSTAALLDCGTIITIAPLRSGAVPSARTPST